MFGSKPRHHLTAVERKRRQGGPRVSFVIVEVQGASAHTTPLFPPHLVHQHRQVACDARKEREMMHLQIWRTQRGTVKQGLTLAGVADPGITCSSGLLLGEADDSCDFAACS